MKAENHDSFKPFIAAEKMLPELTLTSVISGILLAIIFGVVNAYLGLKVGMTISASIPAAVVSMSLTRIIMKRNSILENNIVQTIGSAGESLAAGVIFTIPAMFLWTNSAEGISPSAGFITLIALLGGILGVMFMIPLRKAIIVKEHGHLPYPEGAACADVLLAGEEGGDKAKATFAGMGLGAIYKFLADGLNLFPSKLEFHIKNLLIGGEALPALLGVGFIVGKRIAGFMLAGSFLGWFVIIPIIFVFGANSNAVIFPASVPVSQLTNWDIWNYYIRYIGAGAVALGGMLSLIKSIPIIFETFVEIIRDYKEIRGSKSALRTEKDIPMYIVGITIAFIVLIVAILPSIKIGIAGAFIIVIFGFFFSTVSSRIVGLIGSSSNPISGMTIATLIIASLVFKMIRGAGTETIFTILTVGSIICIVIAVAGDTSQDLKTGFLVGATPYKQQIGEIIGVITTALVLGGVLILLNKAWGFGSSDLPTPQATLVKLVVEGVMQGNLPWSLIFIGIGIGMVIELLELPILPIAIGLYLPIHLTTTIFIGGLVRGILDIDFINFNDFERQEKIGSGILYASGLIAGEGIVGVILALLSVLNIDTTIGLSVGGIGTIILFSFLVYMLIKWSVLKKIEEY
ncbi:putative OPT family oligopeptide transporter [Anaerosolibacter carboniphilus]|uniref:Putative OPT family oligopeptide transporter n=1 Tax=Anaerosolibacter carboniphilus TaxID=1417629 RepID=A0A841KLE1_9FIRM|nr:oligopeptide transporter, OPT family [Anaerosolibacter carboniphilus]MBB6214196.1 putative OPT family oligopeptide transporter [Anaerosolibacter carboniphilus]